MLSLSVITPQANLLPAFCAENAPVFEPLTVKLLGRRSPEPEVIVIARLFGLISLPVPKSI